MANWNIAFKESRARKNSDFRVPVVASLKEKINRYYESTNDDITDWVQSTIDSWVSYYDDTHEDYLRATEELENACDWFSNNLYEFEDKYGYSPDEDLVCEIAQDYASSTLEYLKDTRERFEDDEDWEDEEEFEESKLRESNDDISELEKAIPEEMIGKYGYIDKQKGHIDWETQWPFDLEDLDTFTQAVINLFPSIKTITLIDRDESCPIYHITIKGKDYTVDETSWEDLLEGTEVFTESKLKEKKAQAEGLDDNVKDWYMANHQYLPNGTLNSDITFRDLFIALGEGKEDLAKILGNRDRHVREVIFVELAKRLKVDYEVVYGLWMGNIHTYESKKTDKRLTEAVEEADPAEELIETEEDKENIDSLTDNLSKDIVDAINTELAESEGYIDSRFFTLEAGTELDEPILIVRRDSYSMDFFSDLGSLELKIKYSEFISEAADPRTVAGYCRYLCKKIYMEVSEAFFDFIEDPGLKHYHSGMETTEALSDLIDSIGAFGEVADDLLNLIISLPQNVSEE